MENENIENEVFLMFVRLIGEESDGYYRYEFLFTDNPDEAFGENFEYKPAGLVNDLLPSEEYITEVHIVKTKLKFDLIQNNMCFGMQDAMDGIVAIAYENIDSYDSYPENGRIFFMFGESMNEVERKLALKNILMLNSERKTINENDGDDMGIYKELDDKVIHICYSHNFNVQTRVGNDRAYYAFFIADDRLPKVQEAIQMLEKLGLRRINTGNFSETMHYYTIDFH